MSETTSILREAESTALRESGSATSTSSPPGGRMQDVGVPMGSRHGPEDVENEVAARGAWSDSVIDCCDDVASTTHARYCLPCRFAATSERAGTASYRTAFWLLVG